MTDLSTWATGVKIRSKDMGGTLGLTAEYICLLNNQSCFRNMKVSGSIIQCMEEALILGKTAENTTANIYRIKNMAMACINGMMEEVANYIC